MLLTPRAFLLLLGFAPLLAAAAVVPAMLVIALVYAVIVIAMLVMDARLSPQPNQFSLSRQHDQRLSLNADNAVTVSVMHSGARSVEIWVRDEFPNEFRASRVLLSLADQVHTEPDAPQPTKLSPNQAINLRYTINPPRRGDYRFGDLNLRWRGVFGLVTRQIRIPAATDVRVYPNLLDIRRYELLAKRGHLSEMGFRRVRLLGSGSEFERLREYTADDEFRKIDWNATARQNKPIVREYETERSQNIMIVLDAGRTMRAPHDALLKIDYAINAALMLAYVAGIRGDRVGLLACADEPITYLEPKAGKGQFHRMLGLLYGVQAQPVETSYARALAYLNTRQRKRALVVMFTDIAGGIAEDALVRHISLLTRKHAPLVVAISDPAVVALSEAAVSDSRSLYERALAEQLLNSRALVMRSLRQRGVRTLDVPANKLTVEVINRYLEIKAQGVL